MFTWRSTLINLNLRPNYSHNQKIMLARPNTFRVMLWLLLHSSGLSLFHQYPHVARGSQIMFCSRINALCFHSQMQHFTPCLQTIYPIKILLRLLRMFHFSFHFSISHTIGTGHEPENIKRPAEDSEQVSFLVDKFSRLPGSL